MKYNYFTFPSCSSFQRSHSCLPGIGKDPSRLSYRTSITNRFQVVLLARGVWLTKTELPRSQTLAVQAIRHYLQDLDVAVPSMDGGGLKRTPGGGVVAGNRPDEDPAKGPTKTQRRHLS